MAIKRFENKIWLASPTMHEEEQAFIKEAFDTNWVSTIGENINKFEEGICEKVGCKYAVALASGTSAIHLGVKLAGEKLYGQPETSFGTLQGKRVFTSDMTFAATVNPIVYENGEPLFIDSERDTWNMDPKALRKAVKLYPDVKIVVLAHLYGTPAKIDEISAICKENDLILVEDAAESLGAKFDGQMTGKFGEYNAISFNGNKIITTSGGGMFLTDDKEAADKVRKWSTQAREPFPWYEHEELGYNYRMSNIIAGIGRGQLIHLDEHIKKKKEIYERYQEGFKGLPVTMNPYLSNTEPNFWLSCMLIDEAAYMNGKGATPEKIRLELEKYNVESRPIWKPMHMQPIYKDNEFVYVEDSPVCEDIFARGLCLPSDIKMGKEVQDVVIEIIRGLF